MKVQNRITVSIAIWLSFMALVGNSQKFRYADIPMQDVTAGIGNDKLLTCRSNNPNTAVMVCSWTCANDGGFNPDDIADVYPAENPNKEIKTKTFPRYSVLWDSNTKECQLKISKVLPEDKKIYACILRLDGMDPQHTAYKLDVRDVPRNLTLTCDDKPVTNDQPMKINYEDGIILVCKAGPSTDKATIAWGSVPQIQLNPSIDSEEVADGGFKTAVSTLSFRLKKSSSISDVSITCTATHAGYPNGYKSITARLYVDEVPPIEVVSSGWIRKKFSFTYDVELYEKIQQNPTRNDLFP